MKKSKLYTKTGDKGKTSLVGGQRVSKCCSRLESYGTIDELNAHIGVLMSQISDAQDLDTLKGIQIMLFNVGAYLATDPTDTSFRLPSYVTPEVIKQIEKEIDRLDSHCPPLERFILPSGGLATSQAHVCRTVSRRAERRILTVVEEGSEVEDAVLKYVNRLSDYFFALSRKLIHADGNGVEIYWESPSKTYD
ncbi:MULTISPECIES: cob(I)yrinic acid a,c-diamide adenosyltransferase [Porphyromonas]|uniref:Corrinoid adenosyltransferase n=1 Tax=Porphyromonas canoris TaxID=36875 RepID=A0ABR4XKZ9_9PORP|nr:MULTISPECIES: cob(I)yrinic acid a,c-diamide adenosyltransferase [Porphyromonas]KGL52692.1 cob(I)yrinic acid a c-diamide adenosyltransferase [Porphyromonas canoris]KGN67869.1 cob(I)yrinic acid a c-diamide adenosyltransferase [Porphyromonas sp. COT-108 OH1349]KGN91670.1 cob(I)yrinic acid a c-diamide adenosyltransferase [Porphyromonas canoris]KGN95746.1 cob(I)yrinic acid a c-diamide adenosyltransferase [Porphyromonas sp. COT-108 OH2963]